MSLPPRQPSAKGKEGLCFAPVAPDLNIIRRFSKESCGKCKRSVCIWLIHLNFSLVFEDMSKRYKDMDCTTLMLLFLSFVRLICFVQVFCFNPLQWNNYLLTRNQPWLSVEARGELMSWSCYSCWVKEVLVEPRGGADQRLGGTDLQSVIAVCRDKHLR